MESKNPIREVLKNASVEAFAQQLFTAAKVKGFSYLEVSITKKEGLHLSAGQGALEGLTAYNEQVASLRGVLNGKLGTTYTEQVQVSGVPNLILALEASASLGSDSPIIAKQGGQQLFQAAYSGHLPANVPEKISQLLVLEAAAKSASPEVQKTDFCEYQECHKKRYFMNSLGIDLRECSSVCSVGVSAVAVHGETIRTAFAAETAAQPERLSLKQLGEEAGTLAAKSLKGSSIASGAYPVILVNTVAAGILEGFVPVFCADRVLDKLSLLEGKIGQVIASPLVSIVDDPRLSDGARTMYFDDEGNLTNRLNLVTGGVLQAYLHNEKTATAFNQNSTGHGIRSSHKSSIEVQPSNLWIEKGHDTFDALLRQMGNGLLITDVQGTFAGINAISGDFSLQANGFKVENGHMTDGVHGITISGNFFEMLQEIAGVANDLRFGMPYGVYVGSPSLFVPLLTVAGE